MQGSELYEVSALVEPLLHWYKDNRREMPWRKEASPYHVWVSEIMLQQTRIEAVIGYYDRFLRQLPDVAALAAAPEEQILKLWEGLGYYNRVRNMQKAARIVVECYDGRLPADYDLLLELPGIGSYTAGAIASIAYGIAVPAVDGNVLRVVMRFIGCRDDISRQAVKKKLERSLKQVMPLQNPGRFNEALMELGETICIPNGAPLCDKCPLAGQCVTEKENLFRELPVKAQKKGRRIEKRTVLFVECAGETAVRKRPASGLLAGLWEFPSLDGWLTKRAVKELLESYGIMPARIRSAGNYNHIFSHVEWHMRGYHVILQKRDGIDGIFPGSIWAGEKELEEKYSIPAAFRGFPVL